MNTIKYPYLPEGRTLKYVDPNNQWMAAAKEFARINSTDRRQPTGAVIVKDGRIIASAANQVPLNHPMVAQFHKNYLCIRRLLKIPSGQKYWLCPGCAGSNHHAESRAARQTLSLGNEAVGADMYLWGHWWACEPCWNAAIKTGIRDLYVLEESATLFNPLLPGNIIGKQFE